jgi:hypothetical protein
LLAPSGDRGLEGLVVPGELLALLGSSISPIQSAAMSSAMAFFSSDAFFMRS